MITMNRPIRRLFLLGLLAALAGCAGLLQRPASPHVTLADLQVLEIGLFEQRYRVELRIQNPNDHPLAVRGMDFSLDLNGRDFASGVTPRAFSVPAYGEQRVAVDVVSNLARVFEQLRDLGRAQTRLLSYRLAGNLHLADSPLRLPFQYAGELSLAP